MRTLKKVLALAVVFAFAFTMMAGATIFTDDSSIDSQSQVNLVYALGIMKGYPDGSFGPDQSITRAEAAKMMYVLKTGKDEGSANYVNAANPFSDVPATHWAKGYINYCYLNGIIAGVGGGKFEPEGKLTGAQLAKMLLTVIGYNAEKSGLTGAQWLISTMSLAFENNLFEDYDADVSAFAPREAAAVLFYNTIYTNTVVLRDGVYTNMNSDGDAYLATVGRKFFGLNEEEGIMTAADGFDTFGAAIDEDTITLDNDSDYEFVTDRSLVGQEVKVVYKTKSNGDKVVYDVVPTGDSETFTMTLGDIDDGTLPDEEIKFGGKMHDLNVANFKLYKNYGAAVTLAGDVSTFVDLHLDLKSGDPITLIDVDGDGDLDTGFITNRTFSYVSAKDSRSINFGAPGALEYTNDSDETVVFADGIEEGDYVFYWQDEANTTDDVYYLTKATSVTGVIDGYASGTDTTVYVNGVSGSKELAANTDTDDLDEASQDAPETGDKYTLYLDGKYWVAAASAEESAATQGNYAYVLSAKNKSGSGATLVDPKVEVLIPGEEDPVVYVLHKDSKYWDGDSLESVVLTAIDTGATSLVNKLFAYSMSDGKIVLSQDIPNYTTSADVAYDADSDIFTVTDTAEGHNGSFLLADDAVVFYYTTEWKILGGTDFEKDFTADTDLSSFAYKTSGGFKYIEGAVFKDDAALAAQSGSASDLYFGYLTGTPMVGHNQTTDEDYVKYTMWTDGASKTYTQEETATSAAARKGFVAFTLKADGTIKDIYNADTTAVAGDTLEGKFGDIKAYSSSMNRVTIESAGVSTIYNITDDTSTIYVDYYNVKGTTGSGYSKISAIDAGSYSNVFYVQNADYPNDLLFVVVDTSSRMPN